MGGACSTYGEQDRYIEDFVGRPDRKRQLKNVSLYLTIILKCVFKKWGRET